MNEWIPRATWGAQTVRGLKGMEVTFTYTIYYSSSENKACISYFNREILTQLIDLKDWRIDKAKSGDWGQRERVSAKKQLPP